YGVDEQLLPLAWATSGALSRGSLQRMAAAGIAVDDEEGFLRTQRGTLEQALGAGDKGLFARIYQIQAALAARRRQRGAAPPAPELVLLLDVGPRRCYLQYGERRAALSPVSFAILLRLALSAGSAGDEAQDPDLRMGWVSRRELGPSASSVRKGISRLRSEL